MFPPLNLVNIILDFISYCKSSAFYYNKGMSYTPTKLVVTPEDFKAMFGQDLGLILKGSDNDSNYPIVFLRLVQEFLLDWCHERTFTRKRIDQMSPVQLQAFEKAVLLQAYYTWKNGSLGLGLDSGYDSERGKVTNLEDLKAVEVPERVISLLHIAGLFNLKMKNRPRFNRGYPGVIGSFTGEDY